MADMTTIGTAMELQVSQLEHITNNLANARTTGFKAVHLNILKSVQEIIQAEEPIDIPSMLTADFSQGIPLGSNNPLDLSLRGDGFFVIQTERGDAYTRNGSFSINAANQLTSQEGYLVQGDSGPLTVPEGEVRVNPDGTVTVDGNEIGKLKVVDFNDKQALVRASGSIYFDEGRAGLKNVDKADVQSGFIEMSNVNAIKEMADMMSVNRLFETYQKIIQALQDQDKLAVNRIGRLV